MKLISARIQNFRILKDLFLDFSTKEDKPLTVIQAANETGKTTCLNALIWGLYGSKYLPNDGNYSLFPSDLDSTKNVKVSVEIEFEMDKVIDSGKGKRALERTKYSLQRTCVESAIKDDRATRDIEVVLLWRHTKEGTEQVQDYEVKNIIENALPAELKDVYFTDGDRAMSFIEAGATQSVKRKRVADSIESLLGLKVLDKTKNHLSNVARRFNQDVDNTDYRSELDLIENRIVSYEEEIAESEDKAELAQIELKTLNDEIYKKECQIENILKLGDSSALINQKNKIQRHIQQLNDRKRNDAKSLAKVVSNELVSKMFLGDKIEAASDMLSSLDEKKQLPVINVPILRELLTRKECFCGANLDETSEEGSERKTKIASVLEASIESDHVQKVATSLYYRLKGLNGKESFRKWGDEYNTAAQNLVSVESDLNKYHDELEDIENKIDGIDDSQLEKLKDALGLLKKNAVTKQRDEASARTLADQYQERLKDALAERERVRSKVGKKDMSGLYWDVTTVAQKIFINIVDKLKKEELKKVSDEMNRIFLAMIGSDEVTKELPKRIQRAELTEVFDIMVYGPNDYPLNPDTDLNGASRRAITLAFILALTKVSKVEAPNIIDTPLGMMSGYVKQSVMLRTIEEGSQVILFLTQDEIRGVEKILDKYVGCFFTLTNPSHYPTMLVHKPKNNDIGIIRCECYYDEYCDVCERKNVEIS